MEGPSILDLLWRELEKQTRKLIALDKEWRRGGTDLAGQRGHCLGLAKAIAIMTNPYNPDIDLVRKQVMERIRA